MGGAGSRGMSVRDAGEQGGRGMGVEGHGPRPDMSLGTDVLVESLGHLCFEFLLQVLW